MKPLTRRSITTGIIAAVTAIPAVGLSVATRSDPIERIRQLTRTLEEAMREVYGGEIRTVSWGPHNPTAVGDGRSAAFFVIAHSTATRVWGRDRVLARKG